MPLNPGAEFAGYTVVRLLGVGGMGEVYLAQHPRLPRADALKLLPEHVADDESRQRFLREADVASRLSHPNIVTMLDRGEEHGRLWISMQYVAGDDAGTLVKANPGGLPLPMVDRIIGDAAAGLDHAHANGVLHRDIKPANIMISTGDGQHGRALLADFGIARAFDDAGDVTRVGMALGSVAYASPEQLQALPLDARSDVYSLAATAYTLLTGTRAYDRPTSSAVIAAVMQGDAGPASARRPGLPPAVDQVLARGLSPDPQRRPASAGEFAADLHRALTAAPAPAGPTGGRPGFGATPPTRPPAQQQQPAQPPAQPTVGYSTTGYGRVPAGGPQYPTGSHPAAYAAPPNSRMPWILSGVAVLVLIALGAVAAVLLTDSGSSSDVASSTTAVTTVAPPVTVTAPTVTTVITPTTTTPAYPTYQTADEMGTAIRSVSTGDCVYYTFSGNSNTLFYRVPCSSSSANYRVLRTGTTDDLCDGLPGRYVWTTNNGMTPPKVVVCVTPQ